MRLRHAYVESSATLHVARCHDHEHWTAARLTRPDAVARAEQHERDEHGHP